MNDHTNIESVARARASALLTHEGGLHARPCIKLTQLAKGFASKVWIGISENGPWTDAKSVARVMKMKAPSQTMLYFVTEGRDADEAARALARLVETDFGAMNNSEQ